MVSRKKVLAIWAVGLAIFLTVATIIMASPAESAPKQSSWTKAICTDSNYCIDVRITCVNGQVTDIKPMGEGVQFSGAWEDNRPEEFRDGICV